MKYLFVISFIITYACFGNEIGYTSTSPLWTHFTYMFQHSGIAHLIINSVAFISLFEALSRQINKYRIAIYSVTIAFLASFLPGAAFDIPTVGASAMVYAMIGMYISVLFRVRVDKKKFALYLLIIATCLMVSYFKQNSNFWIHLYALVLGFILHKLKH